MEDNFNIFENGERPQIFPNGRWPQFCSRQPRELLFGMQHCFNQTRWNIKDNLNFFESWRPGWRLVRLLNTLCVQQYNWSKHSACKNSINENAICHLIVLGSNNVGKGGDVIAPHSLRNQDHIALQSATSAPCPGKFNFSNSKSWLTNLAGVNQDPNWKTM